MRQPSNSSAAGFVIVWEFYVTATKRRRFERIYGPDGVWAQFFRRAPEYHGTELIRDSSMPGRYLTLDHWTSRGAYEKFKRACAADYKAIDRKCEALTQKEVEIGRFERLPRRKR